MHSLGDVWHLGSEDLESLPGSALQDLESALSSYLYAGSGILVCRFWVPAIFMHSLGILADLTGRIWSHLVRASWL